MSNTKKNLESEASPKKTYSESEVKKLINSAVAEALRENAKQNTPTVQIVREETVDLLFIGAIANGTTVTLPGIGKITRDGGTLTVPKKVFVQNLAACTEKLLAERKLIVTGGLTADERDRLNIPPVTDDMLTERTFRHLLDYAEPELKTLAEKLCESHMEIVSKVFYEAANNGDKRVSSAKIKILNDADKKRGGKGKYKDLLSDLRAEEEK